MNKKVQELGENNIFQLLMKYMGPGLLGSFIYFINLLVERAFIGRGVGGLALSGVSLIIPLNSVISAFAKLFSSGIGSCISLELGNNEYDKAEQILGNIFTVIIITGSAMIGLLLIFVSPLLRILGASDATLPYAKTYLLFALPSLLLRLIFRGLDRAINSTGRPKYVLLTMIIFTFFHISCAGVFIFGLKMGVKGAAMASNIAYFAATVMVLRYFMKDTQALKLRIKHFKIMKDVVLPVLAIGMSPFSFYMGIGLVSAVAVRYVATYGGDLAVGALGIINMFSGGIFLFINTLNTSAQPIIGFNYGAKKYKRVREALIQTTAAIISITFLVWLLIMVTPKFLIRPFSINPELIKIGTQGLKIHFMLIIPAGIQALAIVFFQAIGKPKAAFFLGLTRRIIFYVPFLVILSYFLKLTGVWLAAPLADFLSFLITVVFLYKDLKHQKNLIKGVEVKACGNNRNS